jgi:hypothetical protein
MVANVLYYEPDKVRHIVGYNPCSGGKVSTDAVD